MEPPASDEAPQAQPGAPVLPQYMGAPDNGMPHTMPEAPGPSQPYLGDGSGMPAMGPMGGMGVGGPPLGDGMGVGEGEDDDDEEEEVDGPPKKKRGGHGRRKIEIEYIEDKIRRHITFSKRKAGISKKAYELSRLTGAQVRPAATRRARRRAPAFVPLPRRPGRARPLSLANPL